jgi:thiosulfate/3-mercaptopyruvate sulfurtransferase
VSEAASFAPVVDVAWVVAHPAVVLADARGYLDGRSGRDAYRRAHLPGAVFVELEECLAAPASAARGRHPLPEPAVFARGMSSRGIGDDDRVVAYDDAGGVIAARLVWMLRVTGHAAAILDGGMAAWDGPRESGEVVREPATFAVRAWPDRALADIDDVLDDDAVVVDARDASRYRGESEPIDPRAGHVPGARSLPCRDHLGPDGRLVAPDEIRRRFLEVGVHDAARLVSYCGSGVTACHNLLLAEWVGLGRGRLFPGSWSQYSATDLPAARGDAARAPSGGREGPALER